MNLTADLFVDSQVDCSVLNSGLFGFMTISSGILVVSLAVVDSDTSYLCFDTVCGCFCFGFMDQYYLFG